MVFTVHGVNISVRNEINANVVKIEHSSRACYPISAERNLRNVYFTPQWFTYSMLVIKIALKYRVFQNAHNPMLNAMCTKHIAL
jgi:hypothetical protein